jgi:c-di-GMP-binding flagellar brake protein YcgR
VPIKVSWPQDSKPVNAKLEDISWGGASIHMLEANMDSGDMLRIFLPRPQGGLIAIEAKALRTKEHADGGGFSVATRFSSLGTRDEAKLEEILEHLSKAADHEGQRSHARLTQRLELQFDGEQELLTTLDDISAGGLGITVPEPVQVGQSLQILISTLDESCYLKLRARVVRQEPVRLHAVDLYRVGLKFEHPSAELQQRTADLIAKVAAFKND